MVEEQLSSIFLVKSNFRHISNKEISTSLNKTMLMKSKDSKAMSRSLILIKNHPQKNLSLLMMRLLMWFKMPMLSTKINR